MRQKFDGICTCCGVKKELNDDNFYMQSNKSSFQRKCKQCHRKRPDVSKLVTSVNGYYVPHFPY